MVVYYTTQLLTFNRGGNLLYLLDWKIPKRLEYPRDQLYDHYLETTNNNLKPNQQQLLKRSIGCFVYNASYSLAGGSHIFDITLKAQHYSLPLYYNCNKVNRKVSYRWTRKFIDWLQEQDLITLSLGSVEEFSYDGGRLIPSACQKSLVELSEGLVVLLNPVSSKQEQEILRSVIELKDEEGNRISKRLGEDQKRLISLLNMYNQHVKDCSISLDGKEYFLQCKKVFNDNSFQKGGRVYMVGSMVTQELLKRDLRGNIKIDGQATASLDFCHLHPSIIAVKEGIVFPDNFDPYQIELEGYDPECLRKVAKLALLIMINSSSPRSCFQALSWECGGKLPLGEWQEGGLVPQPMDYKLIVNSLRDHNSYASNWFFEAKGKDLQYLDSLIIDNIIAYWNEKQVVVLTLHDSVRIDEKYLEELEEVMYSAYESVLGTKDNCRLKRED